MARARRNLARPGPRKGSRRLWLNVASLALTVGALGTVAVLSITPESQGPARPIPPTAVADSLPLAVSRRPDALAPKTLAELLAVPTDQVERVDVGLMNLLCAEGLAGSEGLDIPSVLATLDNWAQVIASETTRTYPLFYQNPGEYENSEPYFRMLVMVTVLQRDLGVHYNMERVVDPDFGNSKDQFLHGMVNSDNGVYSGMAEYMANDALNWGFGVRGSDLYDFWD